MSFHFFYRIVEAANLKKKILKNGVKFIKSFEGRTHFDFPHSCP